MECCTSSCEDNRHPRLLYPVKLSHKNEGEIQITHEKHRLKDLMATKQVLQKILKAILHAKEKDKHTRPQKSSK